MIRMHGGMGLVGAGLSGTARTLLVAAAVCLAAPKYPVEPFDYSHVLSCARGNDGDWVDFDAVGDNPTVYRASGVWTFPYSIQTVAQVALDLEAYPEIFRHVHRCERITEPARILSPLGTWYVEGRATRARVWAIGNIDSIQWSADSTELHLFASQNEHRWLEARWRQVLPRWITLRTHGLRLGAFVVAHGSDSCRVGIVAQSLTNKPMPGWLCELAVNLVLPMLLQDLQEEIGCRNPKPRKKRWWLW